MTDREIMQQALEALEVLTRFVYADLRPQCVDAIVAMRERLAQPEQEPVAWMNGCGDLFKHPDDAERGQTMRPLYTAPPRREWVGLTKEEAKEISLANRPYVVDMIAALEARLKEKNT